MKNDMKNERMFSDSYSRFSCMFSVLYIYMAYTYIYIYTYKFSALLCVFLQDGGDR